MKEKIIGKQVHSVSGLYVDSEEFIIEFKDNSRLKMLHYQDCCENVRIADIDGDKDDLIDGVIIDFTETTSYDFDGYTDYCDDSHTWTFYCIQTTKGYVWIRWLGESNGYYGESVDLEFIE